jgi:hypothetical protein
MLLIAKVERPLENTGAHAHPEVAPGGSEPGPPREHPDVEPGLLPHLPRGRLGDRLVGPAVPPGEFVFPGAGLLGGGTAHHEDPAPAVEYGHRDDFHVGVSGPVGPRDVVGTTYLHGNHSAWGLAVPPSSG